MAVRLRIVVANDAKPRVMRFGPFEANLETGELRKQGTLIRLPEQPFRILALLLEREGGIVTREEIIQELWGEETFVDFEQSVGAAISKLRRALQDSAATPRYIETVRQKGFRLLVPVTAVPDEMASQPAPGPAATRAAAGVRFSKVHLGLAVILLAVVSVGVVQWSRISRRAVAPRSLAVLPFRLINATEDDQYLELGIADALITRLTRLRHVAVRPTSAVRKYSAKETAALQAGRELRVDAVLEGSIQLLQGQLRVTVQLVWTSDGRSLWGDRFDERLDGIFDAQDTIARRVAGALSAHLSSREREGVEKRDTEDLAAFQAYQKGRYLWSLRSPEALQRSAGFFQQAIAEDPNYALAYVGLADTYVLMNLYAGVQRRETFERAKSAVKTALSLDTELAEAYATAAYVSFYYDWDWTGAEASFRRAIELNPNYATSHQWFSEYLFYMTRFPEATAEIERAHELDPQSVVIGIQLASPCLYSRQYERALARIREGLKLEPGFSLGVYMSGICLTEMGRFGEALQEFRKIQETNLGLLGLGYANAKAGGRVEARRILARMLPLARNSGVSPFHVARMYANLGQPAEAIVWLRKAKEERDERMVMLKVDSQLDPLRNDPRFRELLQSIGLDR